MSNHRRLKVFPKARKVALDSREAATGIRGAENAGIKSQLVRSAFSIPTNIIEGNGVQTPKEYSRFVRIAINSSHELDFHLETVRELELVPSQKAEALMERNEEVRKMLSGLLRYLERRGKEEEERKRGKARKKTDI